MNQAQKIDEILRLVSPGALFPGQIEGPGPLLPGGAALSQLYLPSTSGAMNYWAVETENFDADSFKMRFRSPDGQRSREFLFQLYRVREATL